MKFAYMVCLPAWLAKLVFVHFINFSALSQLHWNWPKWDAQASFPMLFSSYTIAVISQDITFIYLWTFVQNQSVVHQLVMLTINGQDLTSIWPTYIGQASWSPFFKWYIVFTATWILQLWCKRRNNNIYTYHYKILLI